ncbi:ABC transporter permease [Catellatospora sichuanensis]|uniref:ABC transporter permease n=1 Tax=Catellatospora sichuanensis TaxID=1969805 RepID=UPI001182B595|nr:ABC transporter permease [Catellatospora sichuanensis]
MRTALHAEWTKLRTSPATIWLLLAAVTLTAGVSAAAAATIPCKTAACLGDPAQISLTGVQLGQAVVVILAVLAVSGEHATGMIRTSLTAVPRRSTLLAAKAVAVTGVTMVTATVAVGTSVLAGRLLLPGSGYTAAHGFTPLSPTDGPTLRAAGGSMLYLCLIALLAVGVATVVRDTGASIGVMLALLYLVPIVTQALTDPDWKRHLQQATPTAGLAIQATRHLDTVAIPPWHGLAVLAAWAAGALLAAAVLIRTRDT